MSSKNISIFWFRRDLRLFDNAGLYHALKSDHPVLPIFIFDKNILDKLQNNSDARVHFIHQQLQQMQEDLGELGSSLKVYYGKPLDVWKKILKEFEVKAAFTNRDYEPYAQERDKAVYELLGKKDIPFKGFKDHVIFEKNEVLKKDGKPYTVFTPYSRIWKATLNDFYLKSYPIEEYQNNFHACKALKIPSLKAMGFKPSTIPIPSTKVSKKIISTYNETRDYPAQIGTSRLGIHLRFGTISPRQLAKQALKLNETFLNELIWRDFYQCILFHFPHAAKSAFKPKYDVIEWRKDEQDFQKWCEGMTGYPMVDAGMRELNATGYMHNRVRMVVASFLTKHLLLDWRWGEAYFAEKLLDFDLAANNGGWQWAAGTGCDAAPYFRIFNPTSQMEKFDKQKGYIKKWIPEFGTPDYPEPMVEHKFARQRALDTYKAALS